MNLLLSLVDANKIGGWVRAGVAAGFVAADAHWPILSSIVDPSTETALAGVLATIAVGIWSHVAKNLTA